MEIKSLENTCFGTLFEAFGQAFADYEVQLDKTQLRRMLRRRGFDPRLSFAAFDGERIAAFTLNGTGNFNGLPTAYDTGTGTLEAYRGQGLAAKVFEHSIPYLREAGIRQYLLEVLQHNTKAVSVYRKLGFETAREFNYSIQQGAHVHLGAKIPDIACTVTPVDVGRFAPDPQFWDFMPSWQNSPEAISRAAGDFAGLSARAEGTQVGYCIFEPASGDIALIAVDKRYRRRGIATSLLREALRLVEKANTLKPRDPYILDSLGWVYYRLKNYEKAKQFLESSLSLRYDAETVEHLLTVLTQAGDRTAAQAELDKWAAQHPDDQSLPAFRKKFGLK